MELLYLIGGLIVGVITTIIVIRLRRAGTLVVYLPDTDDPPYMTLELDQSVGQVTKKKYNTFKVDIRALNTHE